MLDYDPETGFLTWKKRPLSMFNNSRSMNIWNARYAGKQAGAVDNKGYRSVRLYKQFFKGHRLIWTWMTGETPDTVDHINRDTSDNRWSNLRNVTPRQNHLNMGTLKNNTSGRRGVHKAKGRKSWTAFITENGRRKHLGNYPTFEEASKVRQKAEKEMGFCAV